MPTVLVLTHTHAMSVFVCTQGCWSRRKRCYNQSWAGTCCILREICNVFWCNAHMHLWHKWNESACTDAGKSSESSKHFRQAVIVTLHQDGDWYTISLWAILAYPEANCKRCSESVSVALFSSQVVSVNEGCTASECLSHKCSVSLMDQISDTCSQGCTALQSLVTCLDHRGNGNGTMQ